MVADRFSTGLLDTRANRTLGKTLLGRLLIVIGIGILMLMVYWLVWETGGTKFVFLHAMYVPVVLSALLFGIPGGVLAALAGGFLLGPLMPLDTVTGQAQTASAWFYRTAFFIVLGALVGVFARLARQRLQSNERLTRLLADMYGRNLRLFASLVAERDEQTSGHCERVARNAVVLGRMLGLPRRELGLLYWAGLLHDLGKIGVPESILRKPGRLTSSEYVTMQRHSQLGHDILMGIGDHLGPIALGVLTHHERWDGKGYPNQLEGEDIPLFGRILAVADVFEAVTSHRPYRSPMPVQEALRVLADGCGTQFDPTIVGMFLEAHEGGEITREEEPAPMTDAFVTAIVEQQEGATPVMDFLGSFKA